MNIEPAYIAATAGPYQFKESEGFSDRLFIATRNIGGPGKPLYPRSIVMGQPAECGVRLSEFVAWALSIPWDIPKELERMAGAGRDITSDERMRWLREDLWTVRETAFLLCGRVPDRGAPNDAEINNAIDKIKRAVRADALKIVGEPTNAEVLYDAQTLRPTEVIAWTSGRFPKFPFSIPDLPNSSLEDRLPEAAKRDLTPGHRRTLSTLGAYLARKFNYDPNAAKNDATGKVRSELTKYGLKLDDKTIRELMRDGIERLKDDT